MAILFVDGCGEGYTTTELSVRWDTIGGTPIVQALQGRNEGSAIRCNLTTSFFEENVASLTRYMMGTAVRVENLSTTTDIFKFKEGAVVHVIVRLTATGAIEVLNGDATQLGISVAGKVLVGSWAYLEVDVTIDNSAGIVVVNLDGLQLLNLTAKDTRNGGTLGEVDNIRWTGSTDVAFFDDVYVLDATGTSPQNALLGDVGVDISLPISDSTKLDFPEVFPVAPTTHFDKVGELIPDNNLSYVKSSDALDIDRYKIAALPIIAGPGTIYTVQVSVLARKDGAAARIITPLINPGVADAKGAVFPLPTTFAYTKAVFDKDPDTGVAWVLANLEASEIGVELT